MPGRGLKRAAIGCLLALTVGCAGGVDTRGGASPAAAPSGASASIAQGATPVATATTASAPTTTLPAAASVVVSKGDAVAAPSCSSAACAFVTVTTAGFRHQVTCSVIAPDGTPFGVSWQQGPNEKRQSTTYYGFPKTTLTATCKDDERTASGTLTW